MLYTTSRAGHAGTAELVPKLSDVVRRCPYSLTATASRSGERNAGAR
jgi:hypothetical protein